jgi:hypothetical protein
MKITDQQWQEITDAAKAGIEGWNATAVEGGSTDTFRISVRDLKDGVALITEHDSSSGTRRHVVIRKLTDGEVRPATISKKGKSSFSITWKEADPKHWAMLAGKSAEEIIDAIGLLRYRMVTLNSARGDTWTRTVAGSDE